MGATAVPDSSDKDDRVSISLSPQCDDAEILEYKLGCGWRMKMNEGNQRGGGKFVEVLGNKFGQGPSVCGLRWRVHAWRMNEKGQGEAAKLGSYPFHMEWNIPDTVLYGLQNTIEVTATSKGGLYSLVFLF
jgi:hypothetical protein